CRKLGVVVHGTFIMGLPGETHETIEETIRFAKEINPHTIQVSLAAAYPGTYLHKQATENGWLLRDPTHIVAQEGFQVSSLNYPHLSHEEIFKALEKFYKRFYFRPSKIAEITFEMMQSWEMTKRRLREGVEFFRFLYGREDRV
ncbi:MAG TPA: hopanoid biosynthesis associated radical SAM protein HpnJ, partial [Burkholderiales bacterium]|nr:hopanoid biosynthesis associated radical SAM protein HpnJ [Burkholderiales bacterium]